MPDTVQMEKPVAIVGGAHRKGVPWHELHVGDPLEAVFDPLGVTVGDPHPDPNGIAVFWQGHHIGYLPGEIASLLGPLLKQNLIDLVLTLAWIEGPTRVQSMVTVRHKPICAKPST